MAAKLNTQQLIQLNDLIKEHYGKPYNIFFMQGLFVGYLSWPCLNSPRDLVTGQNAVISPIKSIQKLPVELDNLLFYGLYNETISGSKTVNIVPMISLDQVKGKIFRYMMLEKEHQHNLLDWLFGYFLVFFTLWDHKIIAKYVKKHTKDLETTQFWAAIDTLHITLMNLIEELGFKAQTQVQRKILKHSSEIVNQLDDFSKFGSLYSGKVALCKVIGNVLSGVNNIYMKTKK